MATPCSFPDCGRPAKAKRLCSAHYLQMRKGNDLVPIREQHRTCEIEDCQNPHFAKDLCEAHYYRMRRGMPMDPVPQHPAKETNMQRLERTVSEQAARIAYLETQLKLAKQTRTRTRGSEWFRS